MYNKHKNEKTMYSVMIENKTGISFNTEKKRKEFIVRLKGTRKITCITNVSYPWNPENGFHNLESVSDFAKCIGIKDVSCITKAIKNGKLKTELLDNNAYIVINDGNCFSK